MALFNSLGSVFTALLPVPSTSPAPAILFFLLRSSTNVIGLRAAWIASMYLPAERTAYMGLTNVVRTIGSSFGPVITGAIVEARLFWLAFVLSAVILLAYGAGILMLYGGDKGREEAKSEQHAGDSADA